MNKKDKKPKKKYSSPRLEKREKLAEVTENTTLPVS